MILLTSLALLAGIQDEPSVKGGFTIMTATAVGIDAAIAEFDRLCLVSPFDRASYEAAISRSAWRFRRASDGPRGASVYNSSRGYAMFHDTAGLPQCNFDTATQRPYTGGAIVLRIEALLACRLGSLPRRQQTSSTIFWQWPGESEKAVRLYLMRRSDDDPRQFSLSLQKWPAAIAESGARQQESQR